LLGRPDANQEPLASALSRRAPAVALIRPAGSFSGALGMRVSPGNEHCQLCSRNTGTRLEFGETWLLKRCFFTSGTTRRALCQSLQTGDGDRGFVALGLKLIPSG